MKMKLNLSGEGIKEFFFANGEKIVLGITALLLCSFLYSAITAKPLDESKSPDSLKRKSSELVASVQQTGVKPDLEVSHDDFRKKVADHVDPVAMGPYHQTQEWTHLLFPELVKRADPEIYTVTDLQVASGVAIIPYQPPNTTVPGGGIPAPGMPIPGVAPAPRPGGSDHDVAPVAAGAPAPATNPERGPPPPQRIDPTAAPAGVRVQGDPQKKSYAIITGLVPVEKEIAEYRKIFDYAVPAVPDPSKSAQMQNTALVAPVPGQGELPNYFCFLIQRAEVKDAKDANLNWVSVLEPKTYLQAIQEVGTWAAQAPEPVHPDYVFQPAPLSANSAYIGYVTWPLPGMILRNWGFEASHPPQIKFNIAQDAVQDVPGQGAAPGEDGFDNAGAAQDGGAQGGAQMQAPKTATPTPAPAVAPRTMSDHDHAPGPMMGRVPTPMASGAYVPGPGASVANVSHKLFRFVDLTAEPGKTYRYRTQLMVFNPNFGLKQDCLDPKAIQDKSADKRLRSSAWSEPTAPVTIPQDVRLLADTVIVRAGEPKAKVNLLAVVKTPAYADAAFGTAMAGKDIWLEAMKDYEWVLGSIPDLRKETFENVTDMTASVVRRIENASIDAGQTMLVDVRNDDPLGAPPSPKAKNAGPTEILYIDPSGRLTSGSSATDGLIAKNYKERTTVPTEQTYTPPVNPGTAKGAPGHPAASKAAPAVPAPRAPTGGAAAKGGG